MTSPAPIARWLLLVAALLAAALLGIAFGTLTIPLGDIYDALLGDGAGTAEAVVRTIRLPRVLLAALVGAGLGMSGAALQGGLRNPLAEPYLLGVSGGAAVGAVLAHALGAPPLLVAPSAFVGAIVAVAVALGVARVGGGRGDPRLLLTAGVVVGAFANAAIMLLLANVTADQVRNALWWMMGSVADARWGQVQWLALYVAVAGVLLVAWGRVIDVLALGEDAAAGLGVGVDAALWRLFLLASLLAAATVAAAGLVGFVGLVVPHIGRALGFRRHRSLILASALLGATLVVAADLLARTLLPPAELPLGAVTALLGVPFFLARLRRLA